MIDKELKRIGDMLNQFYNLELYLNRLITKYFNPEKEVEFFNIMLNTSITSFGAKVKIISNVVEVDKIIIENLHELGRIRNGIAHVAPHLVLVNKGDKKTLTSKISIMKGNGEIVLKDFWEWSKRFDELLDIVVPIIKNKTNSINKEL